ncbi:DHA2 family multidrug resistance protein-like MFS transporter [Actinoplanes octamycinicus]|uniref:DHA2 family multidrug resistance protein-like MFS transporter n=1 Tax=Actinoplanes octamycinicus TaxID=135948 RepID=A0A7W7MAA7_9ACTN|nr:MFS transporter [Actinoplanes octamycinicus]MBB4742650.1 DHA2 family multidrug resistance protein-like MFS transporter [Actinoplanes octamycinicus]GIE60988.1 MFS transporter [Actinoplanes octamycinicus]
MRTNRTWLGLIILMLPTLIVAMDLTALLLALPALAADLGASNVEQLWISDSYGLVVAALVITMGTLGDRIGRRRLLLIGAAAFATLSLLAATVTSPTQLIVLRALLGVAGATLTPCTLALITTMFPDPHDRGRAIAAWATAQFTGGALGPVLAGLLLQHFRWGSIFLLAVPPMLLLLATGRLLLPEHRAEQPGRLDPASVALSLTAVLLLIYSLKQGTAGGTTAAPLTALLLGTATAWLFVRRQARLATPLLDLRLFRDRTVTTVIVALIGAGIAMAGTGLLVTQYLQGVLGYSPALAAVLFAPMGLGVAAGTMTAPAVARRLPAPTAIAAGLALSALGSLLLLAGSLPAIMLGITVLALGTGPLFALGTGQILAAVPPARAGAAAAMSETGNYFGGSLGFALLGVLAAVIYRTRMHGTSDSLAGALATSHQLPAAEATTLLHEARAAFTTSLHGTALTAALIFTALALLTHTTRRVPAPSAEPAVPVRPPAEARQHPSHGG